MTRRRSLGAAGQFLGRRQDGVVEGVDFLGDGDEGAVAGRAAGLQVGIDAVAVGADIAARKRAGVNGNRFFGSRSLGHGQHEGNARALRAGKPDGRFCAPLL